MKALSALLILLCTISCSLANAQNDVFFREFSTTAVKTPFKNILVIGTGGSVARIFLDKAMAGFVESVEDEKRSCRYEYGGKENTLIQNVLQRGDVTAFDAMILIAPIDTVKLSSSAWSAGVPVSSGAFAGNNATITTVRFGFGQRFSIRVYDSKLPAKPVWEGEASVEGNLSGEKIGKKFQKQLVAILKKEKFI